MEGTDDLATEEGQAEAPRENQVEELGTEGSEIANQTEEGQAEVPGENQVEERGTEGSGRTSLTKEVEEFNVLIREELGRAQRYDTP